MSDIIQDAEILTSITQYFGTNNENEIPDDSSTWVTSGIFYDYEYVWQRTSTTYDDNTTLNTNPILTNNFNKVVSVSYQYFGTNDEEKVPTNNDTWYDEQPVGSSYIWRRTNTEFEDGSHVYDNIELIESGDSEDDGESSTDTGELAPSVEIVSVANQYYGTDNQSYTPDGSETWSEVTPEQYRYLWVRTKTTYSDGTIEYSTPQLDISDDEWSEEGDDVPAPPADEEGSYVPDESPDSEGIPADMNMIIEEGEKTDPVEAQAISDWVDVQQELFDKLTGKGENEGIFYWGEEDGQGHRDLFINASFIRTGVLQLGGSNNDYGVLQLLNQDNDVIGQWDKTGINVNNGVFRVTDTGALTATNATLTGSITANSGNIGGFVVSRTSNTGTSAQGGHIYETSLYRHSADDTYEYEVGMKGDGSQTTGATYLAFYIRRITKGGEWKTADAYNTFFVRNNGHLFATSVDITGAIKATSGTIGNNATNKITIGTNSTNASIYSGMSSLGNTSNNGFYIGTDGIALGKGAFKVTSAGALTATSADITGVIKATSGIIGNNATNKITIGTNATNASIYSGMSTLGNTANNGFYLGTDGIALGKGNFKVTSAGALTAKSATITGTITSGDGLISLANTWITLVRSETDTSKYGGVRVKFKVDNTDTYKTLIGWSVSASKPDVVVANDFRKVEVGKANSMGCYIYNPRFAGTLEDGKIDLGINGLGTYTTAASFDNADVPASGGEKTMGSFSLDPGTWIIILHMQWAGRAGGQRAMWLADSNTGGSINVQARCYIAPSDAQNVTTDVISIVRHTAKKTYYMRASQTTASTMYTYSRYSAIRIHD